MIDDSDLRSRDPRAPPTGRTPAAIDALVVAFDASPASVRAVRLAWEIARGSRAHVWLVFAHRPDPRLAEPRTEEELDLPVRSTTTAMDRLIREAPDVRVERVVREGDPSAVILEVATEVHANLILVGSRGLGNIARVVLGSVSARLVSESHVPVTVVP